MSGKCGVAGGVFSTRLFASPVLAIVSSMEISNMVLPGRIFVGASA
jgi:hypothetical protein